MPSIDADVVLVAEGRDSRGVDDLAADRQEPGRGQCRIEPLEENLDRRSQIHRKKPKGAPMPRHTAHANAHKSAIRSAVEHVFARQKGAMSLFVRTIGIARARTKIGLANLLYNMQRMVWLIEKATATYPRKSAVPQPEPVSRYNSLLHPPSARAV